jgi:hypothetical protein
MSVGFAERDWFRQQDADRRPVITLRVRRFTWVRWGAPVAIVAVLLAGAAYQEWRLTPPMPTTGKPIAPPRAEPAPAAAADAVAFPKDGFTLIDRRPGSDWNAPLTVRIPTDTPYRHWIVSVRDWATGKWVATVYLSNGVITTVLLPSGFYRVAMAAGSNWQGEARLFGAGTAAWEWTSAVSLTSKSNPVLGSPMHGSEITAPLAWDAFRTR